MEEKVFENLNGASYHIGHAQRPPMEFQLADIVLAFGALGYGFLFWNLLSQGAGVMLFTIAICGGTFAYLQKSGIRQNSASLAWLAIVMVTAAQFLIFDNAVVKSFGFVFLMMSYMYWVCVSADRQIEKKLSIYVIGDGVLQGIVLPFSNFLCCGNGIKKGFVSRKGGKSALSLLAGILIALPILVMVIKLLVSADSAFENAVVSAYRWININQFLTYGMQFVMGIPVAFYIYGLLYGNVKGRYTGSVTRENMDRAAIGARFMPRLTVYSALAAFNSVYLVFFLVQAVYLFSAFQGTLPETFTYAEYARRGFFELCTVSGINLAVLAAVFIITKRSVDEQPKGLRIQSLLICSFTILFIITALSKMAMYIESYGLTQLRVFTSWFMILLILIFIMVFIRQIKRFNASRAIIVCFVAWFLILSYGNTDGLIAKYNIGRYQAGTLSSFDVLAVTELSDGALPHVYAFYLELDISNPRDAALKEQLKEVFQKEKIEFIHGNRNEFREINWQKWKADQIRKELVEKG